MRRGIFAAIAAAVSCGSLAVAACSGSASTGLFAGGSDGAAATEASAPTDAAPDAGGDGTAPDKRIDPLELGRTWVFEITGSEGGITSAGCAAGTQTSAVVGPGAAHDGSATVRYQPLCSTYLVDALVEGDKLTAFPVDGGVQAGVVLDAPVQEGHSWSYGPTGPQFVWHFVGTIAVPAGKFDDCWARAYVSGSQSRFIYCRGVGLTQLDDTDFGYRAVLTSKNF
jgi:hypothetical protein